MPTAIKSRAKSAPKSKSARKAAVHIGAGKGAYTRTILYVTEFARAVRFYRDTLGLKLAYPAEGGWAEFTVGSSRVCLHSGRTYSGKAAGIAHVGFSVADLDGVRAALLERGVSVDAPASPCPGLRYCAFRDPDGNELSIEGE
jgi:catechol 2,3-dioxygenase-like lactoylglutathione lyase family enzyme